MTQKEIISPGRLRRLPEGFGWVDHRLVRENVIENFSAESLALYLFLITVGDEDGVSWYADESICRRLNFELPKLKAIRRELVAGELVAYRKPHYQVLELPHPQVANSFRQALNAAIQPEPEWRQPAGTEGMGVSLHPSRGVYRRGAEMCDALPISTIINAMAGGVR